MSEKKEYRSAIRSRKLIRKAFIELLKEKNFEKITVTDIVKKAEINRSTFYAHYPDVMGVIEEIQQEILDYAQKILMELDFSNFFELPQPLLKEIVKIAEENHELYSLLCHSNIAAKQLDNLKKILIERTLMTIKMPETFENTFQFEFSVRFFMGGVIDVYTQWLNGELECTLDEITEQLASLISSTTREFIYQKES